MNRGEMYYLSALADFCVGLVTVGVTPNRAARLAAFSASVMGASDLTAALSADASVAASSAFTGELSDST